MSGLPLIDTASPFAEGLDRAPIVFHWNHPSRYTGEWYTADVAGIRLWLEQPLEVLQTRRPTTPRLLQTPHCIQSPGASDAGFQLRGEGWLNGRMAQFNCTITAAAQSVFFSGIGAIRVHSGGTAVDLLELPSNAADRDELICGPALLLALAERGIFGLHAAALQTDKGAILLIGASGRGKSTLARCAAERGIRRLSDDVTAVTLTAERIEVRARFPQLKLSPALCVEDAALPLCALIWIERAVRPATLAVIDPPNAHRQLLRDSVAARLFRPDRLAAHLQFCAELAARVPCLCLSLAEADADGIDGAATAALDSLARAGWL